MTFNIRVLVHHCAPSFNKLNLKVVLPSGCVVVISSSDRGYQCLFYALISSCLDWGGWRVYSFDNKCAVHAAKVKTKLKHYGSSFCSNSKFAHERKTTSNGLQVEINNPESQCRDTCQAIGLFFYTSFMFSIMKHLQSRTIAKG